MAFSFKTGALHAALFVIAFLFVAMAASALWARDGEAAGRLLANLMWVAFGLGFLVSIPFQRGRRRMGVAIAVLTCAIFPAWLFIATRANAITADDRTGLEPSADSVRHRGLGFAFPTPGPGFRSDDSMAALMQARVGRLPAYVWVLSNPDDQETVIVTVHKGLDTEHDLRGVVSGFRAAAEGSPAALVEDTLVWTDSLREARVALLAPNGVYAAWRCLASFHARPALLVCVMTVSSSRERLAAVRSGLRWDPGR